MIGESVNIIIPSHSYLYHHHHLSFIIFIKEKKNAYITLRTNIFGKKQAPIYRGPPPNIICCCIIIILIIMVGRSIGVDYDDDYDQRSYRKKKKRFTLKNLYINSLASLSLSLYLAINNEN